MSKQRKETGDAVLIECETVVTEAEVLRVCAISRTQLERLVAEQVVAPAHGTSDDRQFDAEAIRRIKTVERLRRELDLDLHAAAIVMELMAEIRALRARLP